MYVRGLNSTNMYRAVNYNFQKNDINNNKSIKVENKTNFSLKYSSKGISSIMKSIKNCFESSDSLVNTYYDKGDGKHLVDRVDHSTELTNENLTYVNKVDDPASDMASFTKDYGEILNKISSDDELSDTDKKYLGTILDKSFDNYSDKLSKTLSDKISGFLNYAADNKEEIYKKYGIKITADKIVNEEDLRKNIKDMFSTAKIFYKNNPHGSDEDLDAFVDSKFNITKDINNISYKDLIAAKNVLCNGGFNYTDKNDDKKLNSLLDGGASNILAGDFQKAYYQNKDFKLRAKTYNDLKHSYEDGIKKLEDKAENLKKTLENFDKEAQDVEKEYQYSLRDMQEKKMNAQMLLSMLSDGNKEKKVETLQKEHDRTLQNISKQRAKVQGQISNILKQIKEKNKEYKEFIKDPNSAIEKSMKDSSDSNE